MQMEMPENHPYINAKIWQFWIGHSTAYTRVLGKLGCWDKSRDIHQASLWTMLWTFSFSSIFAYLRLIVASVLSFINGHLGVEVFLFHLYSFTPPFGTSAFLFCAEVQFSISFLCL